MDNLSLEALVRELRPRILNKAIQKIRMADERTIVFYLRSDVTERLVVSLHPVAPGLFIAGQNRLVESRTPDAMLTLRKYLVGGKIKQVRKELAERVVFLEIENYRRSNEVERSSLVLEFIPNKVRCWLLDGERNVLAAYPAIQTADREVATPYEPPALKSCYRVDAIQQDQLLELLSIQSSGSNEKQIAGLSPIFVRELVQRGGNDPQAAWVQLEALLNQIRQGPYLPRIYSLESSADNSDSENDK
jgi:predicted ribosome quality control (RQC) complex YloA/Tae2 family protein